MSGIRNFIIGFCLSLFSVTLCEQLKSSASSHVYSAQTGQQIVKMDLFKTASNNLVTSPRPILASHIKKQSLDINQEISSVTLISNSIEGEEDDEIISINFDDQIPIEMSFSSNSDKPSLPAEQDDTAKVAMLPSLPTTPQMSTPNADTPWITAKTTKSNQSKKLEDVLGSQPGTLFTENIQQLTKDDNNVSYKVAERIKQSIIFPIPDDILNDENLTPTFIQGDRKKTSPNDKSTSQPKVTQNPPTENTNKKNIASEQMSSFSTTDNTVEQTENSGILNSISSWFNTPKQDTAPTQPQASPETKKKKAAPTYGTGTNNSASSSINKQNDTRTLADIYTSLQETRQEYSHRKIIPSELKLSFQPQRAEISGSTLTWLKAFSEAALFDDIYLQVRLDASASASLQRKRLNLLYTIFMNNGVDFKKVDTVFSKTEPNAFIIRTIRIK